MEMNVDVAVRICPTIYNNEELHCVKANACNNTINLGNSQSFPVHYALPNDCTQSTLFALTVTPLINYLFDGCDVSVVTFGQSGCGKSYTLLGPGLSCTLSESEYGVIPRFLREVFSYVCQRNDRNYLIHVTWTQICGENVQDLLGSGSVECNSVSGAFELLQLGMTNILPHYAHTLFTITIEQQWVIDSTVHHRISTASFVDLSSGEKLHLIDGNGLTQSVPKDTGLITLQRCIWALTEPSISLSNPDSIPYNQSALTMLLKDSFGGRAKTLLICCVSPLINDYIETVYTLQFGLRAQLVRNFVTINAYTTLEMAYDNMDLFGLQFAANQLFKLVSNAECLFKNLIVNNNTNLSKNQVDQISQWLTLKQECKDCISESSEPQRSLEIIEEEIEDDSSSEESEVLCEDDEESNVLGNLEDLMHNFGLETDNLIAKINSKYNCDIIAKDSNSSSSNSEYRLKGARGRRGSIHSAEEFVPLNCSKISSEEEKASLSVNVKISTEKMLKQVRGEIEGYDKQMKELEGVIKMKERLLESLFKYKNTNVNIREKLKQKYQQLQNEQQIVRSKLNQAKTESDHDKEQKYHSEVCEISQRLREAEMIKDVTGDGSKKIIELENSLRSSRKQLEKLKKRKLKEESRKADFKSDLKKKNAKIPCALRPKSQVKCPHDVPEATVEELERLRHEIKELRKTRDFILEQICKIDTKSNLNKMLNDSEEYKLFECEEAIEAVDMAIEYKNQMICSCASLTMSEQDDKIEKMLMAQFMKLSIDEIRVLLKKYFQKVIDLRSITKKLEQQTIEFEYQNENLLYRIQNLSQTLQRVRLETECRILALQQQHESKLQLVMRHLDEGGGGGAASDCVMSQVVESSKQAALAFQVTQRSGKQIDKGSLIARFTRYARQETVPRQLQAAITPPQAKVTRQKNKLIIQQSTK